MVPAPRSWRANSAVVCGPMSSAISSAAMPSAGATRAGAPAAASRATTTSVGITSRPCAASASARISRGHGHLVAGALGRADLVALGGEERVGHGAADEHRVGDGEHVPDEADLVGDLEAAQHDHERPRGVAEQAPEHLDLLGHEQAGDRGQVVRDALGGGVRPVRGAEGVVDVRRRRAPPAGARTRRRCRSPPRGSAGSRAAARRPAAAAAAACAAAGPTQSSAVATGRPSSSERRAATGAMRSPSTTCPLGRPRWDMSTTAHPWSSRYEMVGRAARMRVSSTTRPSASGTLKSTRTSTRLPASG